MIRRTSPWRTDELVATFDSQAACYASHHLPADMAFAAAVERERGLLRIRVRGDVAWVTSTSRARGTYREHEIDSRGAELVVLSRSNGQWRIEAIHWSSR